MSNKQPLIILEGDVFELTPKAQDELGGAGTSLSALELQVLVLIDGKSTVGETLARAHALGIEGRSAEDLLGKLVEARLIKWRNSEGGALDFVDFFSVKGETGAAMTQLAEVKKAASETSLLLQQQGYFVRIVRRPAATKPAVDMSTASILVIEDEAVLARMLKYVLEAEGFRVRNAMNRQEIVDQIRCAPIPDLILLDVMLPDTDGFQVLERIRQHPVLKTVPVVMLTAKATREAVLKGLKGGANGYVTKPFEIPVLTRAVHAVLGLAEEPQKTGAPKDQWSRR